MIKTHSNPLFTAVLNKRQIIPEMHHESRIFCTFYVLLLTSPAQFYAIWVQTGPQFILDFHKRKWYEKLRSSSYITCWCRAGSKKSDTIRLSGSIECVISESKHFDRIAKTRVWWVNEPIYNTDHDSWLQLRGRGVNWNAESWMGCNFWGKFLNICLILCQRLR